MDRESISPFTLVLLLVFGIESIITFLGNGFIIAVNGQRWLRSRKMLPCDLLLTIIGTTRFLWQSFVLTSQLLNICSTEFFCQTYSTWVIGLGVFIYFTSANIWCATWLSVFYCLKVTNFAHRLFLWLKLRIDTLVPKLIGLSLTVLSFPFGISGVRMNMDCSSTENKTENAIQGEDSKNDGYIFISLQFTFIAISVSICLTTSILLLTSLWRHTRNLKRNGFATKDCNTQAHIRVVYSLLSFLFFYSLYVVAFTSSVGVSLRPSIEDGLLADVALSLCCSAHSVILIVTNPKLKDVCVRILKIR